MKDSRFNKTFSFHVDNTYHVWTLLSSVVIAFSMVNSCDAAVKQPGCAFRNHVANCSMQNLSAIPTLPNDTKTLIFTYNHLRNVTKDTFAILTVIKLEILKLDYCDIHYISIDAFNDLETVKHLDISGNPFKRFEILITALSYTNLQILELAEVRKSKWNATTFRLLSNLPITKLNLEGNRLAKISVHEVNLAWFSNLTTLNLSYNDISVFSLKENQLPNMKELRLKVNQLRDITSLCRGRSHSLRYLKFVDVSQNAITELTKRTMNVSCLRNLTQLVMNGNRIAYIHNNVFTSLASLTKLSLDMSGTSSPKLHIDKFAFNSTSLKELSFAMNEKELDISDVNVRQLFRHCSQLRILTLTSVRFSNYNISEILSPLKKLRNLTIYHGSIQKVPSDLISEMKELEYLSFRGNYITSWDPNMFATAFSLKTLIISINQITHINQASLPEMLWKNLTVLDLAFNPFDCTCELEWFRNFIKRNMSRILSFPNHYYCKSPTEWKDRRLVYYKPSHLECHHLGPVETSLIVVGSIVIVVIVIAVMLHRYKWHIKHYIYLMRARREYKIIPDGDDFIYDAFVSYNTADRIWVFSQLRPFLEEKHNLRLCLHERDFEAGRLIVDNITDHLKLSKKVIMVLSNNFAKSQWCQFEVLMAKTRFMEEGESSLVLLMMEDISSRYVGGPLKLLLQAMTYIQWTNDQVGKELFWNKLITSIK